MIAKRGKDRKLPGNYRPIGVFSLQIFPKQPKLLFHLRLRNVFSEGNFLSNEEFGFRRS